VRFENIRLKTGLRLHYAECGNPDGEPVVFLHGWPDSWFSFSRLLPLLPESLHAVAVDQRGFGDSDRPESGYAIPDMGADVIPFSMPSRSTARRWSAIRSAALSHGRQRSRTGTGWCSGVN
jgi:pimeloyl-ACP methyl ester carboxylesterase